MDEKEVTICSHKLAHYHLVVVGVLGVGGLILAIKHHHTIGYFRDLLLPKNTPHGPDSSTEGFRLIPGLQNLGNNCFLNVVLQALASCGSFHRFVEGVVDRDGFSAEDMPLTNALADLFRELCTRHEKRIVLSPRKVMLAMDDYIPNFNLTMQQDAQEAFLLLLSSFREELSEFYIPHHCSLADINAVPLGRISCPLWGHQSEQPRWQKYLFGPFDGILCSTLGCRSCSSQISISYEFFNSLSLSPLVGHSGTILVGSSVENCLRKFTAAELIENYRCNQCWHTSAIKYLSAIDGNEAQLEKLKCCVKEDSCDCINFFPEKALMWSNSSYTTKQLHVARCPKILCIHLQRASVNWFGESVKLQGHISFPMILDLFPFTKDAIKGEGENIDENFRMMKANQHYLLNPRLDHLKMQLDKQMLKSFYGTAKDNVSEAIVGDKLGGTMDTSSSNRYSEASEEELCVPHCEGLLHPKIKEVLLPSDTKIDEVYRLKLSNSCLYKLVSVVEHFGVAGTGHYTVYRRVKHVSDGQDSTRFFEPSQWYCVSDAIISRVSERDVLAAEASMLFYEKIDVPKQVPSML